MTNIYLNEFVTGLLEPQKEFAVRNCIDKLTMILQISTKKRPLNPPSLTSGPCQDQVTKENKNKYKQLLAEQMSKLLIKKGMQNIDEWYLHYLVYEVAKNTLLDDGTLCLPPSQPTEGNSIVERPYETASNPQGGYSTGLPSVYSACMSKEGTKSIPPKSPNKQGKTDNDRIGNNDELDDLTIVELKSLLDNFNTLAKSEQMDLIQYMKKLETSNPEKVRQIKTSFSSAMLAEADVNDDQNVNRDGIGSAMLQLLARNVHSFTNDSSASRSETQNR